MPAGKLLNSILKRLPKSKTSGVLKTKEKLRRIQKDLDDYSKGSSPSGASQSTQERRKKQALKPGDPRPIEDRANKVREDKKRRTEKRDARQAMSPEERKKLEQERKKKLEESIAALKNATKDLQEEGEKGLSELSKSLDKFRSDIKSAHEEFKKSRKKKKE